MTGDYRGPHLGSLPAELAAVDGARPVGLAAVRVGRGALEQLPGLLEPCLRQAAGPVAVLTDGVPMSYAGADLHAAVTGLLAPCAAVRPVVAPATAGRVSADPATLDDVAGRVADAAALVTVGSGTLADIGKAISARHGGLPHAIVQTALSVNGFADDQSVLLVDGVKRTTRTRWPDILVADTDVLCEAPAALNAAGVGDLLAMFTAPADWRLATLLGMGQGYQPGLVSLVTDHGPGLLAAAPRLRSRDPQAVEYVAALLARSGVAMGAAGTTAPASGAEHAVSHLIEMSAHQRGQQSAFHGAQVGVAAVLAALIWRRVRELLGKPPVRLQFPAEQQMAGRVRAAFRPLDPSGAMGAECWRLYRRKLARWAGQQDRLAAIDWCAVDAAVAPLLAEPEALAGAGAPARFGDLDPPQQPEVARWALACSHLMRDRFSVVDLAFFLGAWDTGMPEEVLAEAGRLGPGL